jgi:hypothetical protein
MKSGVRRYIVSELDATNYFALANDDPPVTPPTCISETSAQKKKKATVNTKKIRPSRRKPGVTYLSTGS